MTDHIPNVLNPFERPYATREERKDFAEGLRRLADWVETTNFPLHWYAVSETPLMGDVIQVYGAWMDDEDFVRRPGSAARLIGGLVEKGTDSIDRFTLARDFGGGVRFRYVIERTAVCEAVEVPTTTTQQVYVDGDRAAELAAERERIEAELAELETLEEVVRTTKTEFVCPPALLPNEAQAEIENRATA